MALIGTILLIISGLYIVWKSLQSLKINLIGPWKNAPPGPKVYPFFGMLPELIVNVWKIENPKSPISVMNKLHETYGEDITLNNGREDFIVLSSVRGVKEFSSHPDSSFRPYNKTLMDMYSEGEDLGVGVGLGGGRWNCLRRFSLKTFKTLSGGSSGLNRRIEDEVSVILQDLKLKAESSSLWKNVNNYFDIPMLNIVWELVAGKRYDYEDPVVQKQFHYLKLFLEEPLIGPLTMLPLVLYVPSLRRVYWTMRNAMRSFRVMIKSIIDEKRKDRATDYTTPGFMDEFLSAMEADPTNPYLSEEDLVICCQDFFLAGAETSSKTLCAFVLHMVLHPDVQDKAQKEIDRVVGRDGKITSEHRSGLIYTDAALMEVRRYATPFPLTPFRCANSDITVNGFAIPARVPVQINLNALFRNKNCWKDPDVFNPERFIDSNGNLQVPEAFLPFGYGCAGRESFFRKVGAIKISKGVFFNLAPEIQGYFSKIWKEGRRRCIGEDIGNVSNFLVVANILQNFTLSSAGGTLPNERLGGIIHSYEPFNVVMRLRE